MCGRYSLRRSFEEILADLQQLLGDVLGPLDGDNIASDPDVTSDLGVATNRYNIRPSNHALVLRRSKTQARLGLSRWGFQPPWMTEDYQRTAKRSPFINARLETAHTARAFADATLNHRCLVIADGFYESKTAEGGKRTPYFFDFRSENLFFMAGIEAAFPGPDWHAEISNFAILTQEATPPVRDIHHRMPVMLDAHQGINWLNTGKMTNDDGRGTVSLASLGHRAVSTWINKREAEGPACLNPPVDEQPSAQASLF